MSCVILCAALMLIIALGSVTTGGWAAMIHPEYNRSKFASNLLVVAVVHQTRIDSYIPQSSGKNSIQ